MSYGPAVEVRWEDLETETGPETVGARYPLEVVEIGSDGSLHENFRAWRDRHPEAEIIDIKYGFAADGYGDAGFSPVGSILVIYRDREDTSTEAGEEGER